MPARCTSFVSLALTAHLGACAMSTRPARPPVMAATTELAVPPEQLRLRTVEQGAAIVGLLELAADTILAAATDPRIRRNALLWKANLVPAVQASVVQFDPLVSFVDLFALCVQADELLRTGAGRGAFGEYQDGMLAATAQAVASMRALGQAISKDASLTARGERVAADWARSHPIASLAFARQTMTSAAATAISGDDRSAFAAVGRLEGNVTDLNTRVALLMAYLPKQMRWEAQLYTEELLGRSTMDSTLADFTSLTRAATRFATVAESLPALLDLQRRAALDALTAERAELIRAVGAERAASFTALSEQMSRVLTAISAERAAALSQTEQLIERSLERSQATMRGAIDHLVWRLAQLAAGALALAALAAWAYARRRGTPAAVAP